MVEVDVDYDYSAVFVIVLLIIHEFHRSLWILRFTTGYLPVTSTRFSP